MNKKNRENLLLSVWFLQISLESFCVRFPVPCSLHITSMTNMSTCMFWVTLRFISNLHWLNDEKIQSNILEWDLMVKSNRRRAGCVQCWRLMLKTHWVHICLASILNWMFGALCLPFNFHHIVWCSGFSLFSNYSVCVSELVSSENNGRLFVLQSSNIDSLLVHINVTWL